MNYVTAFLSLYAVIAATDVTTAPTGNDDSQVTQVREYFKELLKLIEPWTNDGNVSTWKATPYALDPYYHYHYEETPSCWIHVPLPARIYASRATLDNFTEPIKKLRDEVGDKEIWGTDGRDQEMYEKRSLIFSKSKQAIAKLNELIDSKRISSKNMPQPIKMQESKDNNNFNLFYHYSIVLQRVSDDLKSLTVRNGPFSLDIPDQCPCPLTEQQCCS